MLAAALLLAHAPDRTIVEGARRQLEHPALYDARYAKIGYPGGDVARERGVCVDVIIRALRYAGADLQVLIHNDMKKRFYAYPRIGDHPDANIDHRRVPNQIYYLQHHARGLPRKTTGTYLQTWHAGDLVYWKLDRGLDHCGVVSDRIGPRGLPMVIRNISRTAEEDVLDKWKIVAHFRYLRVSTAKS